MAVDAEPIGRITFQEADPAAQTDAAPGSQAALPVINPSDSPYQPLNLPKEEPKQIPIQEQAPVQNLGAASHGGSIAYLADQVLRGAMKGYDTAQAHKADQFNRKLTAQQAIYNDQAKQFYEMAASGVDPKSEEFRQARGRVLAAWQATMQTIGERIPQPNKSAKSKQGQQNGTDQSSLIARAMNHQNDPQDALQAVYQGAVATGPPVFHQIQPYLSPQYQAQQRQKAQTSADTSTAAGGHAAAEAELSTLVAKPNQTPEDKAKIDQLKEQLSPSQKFPIAGVKRSGQSQDGKWYEWQEDQEGREIANTRRPISSAGLGVNVVPKAVKYDPLTGQLIDPATGKRWSENDPDLPEGYKQIFAGAKQIQAQKNASKSSTTSSIHTIMVDQVGPNGETIRVPVQVESTSTHSSGGAISHPSTGATAKPPVTSKPTSNAGVVSTGQPVGWKDAPETKGLAKQSLDAQNQFNGASTNLSTMLKTAAEAKRGNGPAQVGIVSAYLKTVVGGQGTGVRITKAEWDAAVKTRPLLEGAKASFSPDGYLTGAVISPTQVDQMVQEVHAKTKALYENAQSAKQRAAEQRKADIPANLKPPQTQTPTQSKGTVSIAEAMQKPKYKGQSKEQVSTAITAAGYTPVE